MAPGIDPAQSDNLATGDLAGSRNLASYVAALWGDGLASSFRSSVAVSLVGRAPPHAEGGADVLPGHAGGASLVDYRLEREIAAGVGCAA